MFLFCKPNKSKNIIITESQARHLQEMLAYHGSKADFDQFSLAYMGTGIGAQEFGYGIYLTLDKEAAEHYGGVTYTVEIPDPDKALYLYYNEPIPNEVYDRIINAIVDWNVEIYPDEYDESTKENLIQELKDVMPPTEGRYLMYNLHKFVDEKTYAAQMLKNCGVTGFFYNNGKIDNVVIFDTKAIHIIEKNIIENQQRNGIIQESESTFDEPTLRADYEEVDYMTPKEKKVLAAKYGSASKGDEIKKAILLQLRQLRHNKTEFNQQDVLDFMRLGANIRNIIDLLKEEPNGMVEPVMNYIKGKVDRSNLGQSYQKLLWKIEDNLKQLKVKSQEEIEQEQKTQASIDSLVQRFTQLMENYKNEYLKRVASVAEIRYNKLPDEIERLMSLIAQTEGKLETLSHGLSYTQRIQNSEVRNAREQLTKLTNKRSKFRTLLQKYPTSQDFVNMCVDEANKTFEHNIQALSARIVDKGFDIANIQVQDIKEDPKIFDLIITDGQKTLHCRSIIAAEFSDYMKPHYRFIMT